MSLSLTLLTYGLGTQIPLTAMAAPLWLLYAVVAGTVAGGCWVIAHECGHRAFHPNPRVEATVGFVLHSMLLVPYFSWQHSHAVHHANGRAHRCHGTGVITATMRQNGFAHG
jgi:omega-6 fatty acid desaturase (delta-12 desaturase)